MDYYLEVIRKYTVFDGRARRKEYWYFVLFNTIISFVIGFVDGAMGLFSDETGYGLFSGIYSLAMVLPSIAVGVRRMHDVGKSGWFILIPIYNLILALTEGEHGENQYGPDPKNIEPTIIDHLV